MSRQTILAANWKMHGAPAGFDAADSPYKPHASVDVIVFPSFLDIRACVAAKITTGGQWGCSEPDGAFTGDVSMRMLHAAGCTFVLCGHSERRHKRGETDDDVEAQVIAALEAGLHPIVCVGETDKQRENGKERTAVKKQVMAVPHGRVTFAYEPVWAIGTGKTATPEIAQEMHAFIRSLLPKDQQATTQILYGGSTNPMNARELLRQDDIDGLLVGGAALKPDEFRDMVASAAELSS